MNWGRILVLVFALAAAAEAHAAPFALAERGIYIGRDGIAGSHCFVQVLDWSPAAVRIRTRTRTTEWSEEMRWVASRDSEKRVIFSQEPGEGGNLRSLGVRFGRSGKVATIREGRQQRLCKNLSLAR
jgi:hypothetical protein